jgi:uncharacterized membrane protein YphA (DoxX/SURF4 family)
MNDYFTVFGMPWATSLSLYLTIFLCTLEFILGISLLFNLWIRVTAWPLLLVMIYFTVLTYFDAAYNIVPDCGCFGDVLKLTNLQTFIKNLILMGLIVPIFIMRKKFRGVLSSNAEIIVLLIFICLFAGMSVYSYRHLPVIDFLSWKVGNQVNKKSTEPAKFYLTFKSEKTGETREYLSPDYPWSDSVWMSEWKFLSQRVIDPDADQGIVLRAEDEDGNDVTSAIIDNPDYQFILVAYDLNETNKEAFKTILPFYKQAESEGYSFVCITSATLDEIRKFRIENGTAFKYYTTDDKVLKIMIRSNPGLILLKNGIVIGKWHYNDFPEYNEIMRY